MQVEPTAYIINITIHFPIHKYIWQMLICQNLTSLSFGIKPISNAHLNHLSENNTLTQLHKFSSPKDLAFKYVFTMH